MKCFSFFNAQLFPNNFHHFCTNNLKVQLMKNLILLFALPIIFFSCEKTEDNISGPRNVVSEIETIQFEELILLLNIKTSDSTYLATESIDSVNIYINNFYWANCSSEQMDTSKLNSFYLNSLPVTNTKLNYLVTAPQDIEQPEYNTAGDYASYLNASYELKPGEYVCFIESFVITQSDNTQKKYYPFIYKAFKVENNSQSAFVGEIELLID